MDLNLKMIEKYFYKKKIMITGHTGFKGSWLSLIMKHIGADVFGISNEIITKPSNFKVLKLDKIIKSKRIDIRNYKKIKKEILKIKPHYIFHLAAEAIVKKAYDNPRKTWETNTMGTINILDSLKEYKKKITVIIITSDKVYKNQEIKRGYKENDILGGLDPYSASKASADLAVQSYISSFLKKNKNIKIAIARAGNVIGGGDWSDNRLVPDCIKSWNKNKTVNIRSPNSTRPWQHVLDVLYGYILLSINLHKNKIINGESFNFGPKITKENQVINVVKQMKIIWSKAKWKINNSNKIIEAKLLHLNSNKSKKYLGWSCVLNLKNTINYTILWYKSYYNNPKNIYNFSIKQIKDFLALANK